VKDGTEGWITLKGNHGTPFLQDTPKPYLVASEEILMQNNLDTEGATEIGTVKKHEILEVLEGPRKDSVTCPLRARAKALKDGVVGWFTVSIGQGQEFAKPGQTTYVCVSAIALTSDQDIASCTVLRKLDKDEVLTCLEGPLYDDKSSTSRIRAKAEKDGVEGWVTVKGNAGTVYVKEHSKQYVITKETPLQREIKIDTDQVRMLAEGEVLDVIKVAEEQSEPVLRMHVRAMGGGVTGWVTKKKSNVVPWTAKYRCVAATSIDDKLETEAAKSLRTLEPGETMKFIDGPKTSDNCMRIKVRTVKDGLEGWVTACNKEGKSMLECSDRLLS